MATKNSNGNGGSVETKQLKTPKPGELLKLFKEYDKAQQAYLDAEAALAEASQKRSVAVQAIAEFGNGPFEWPAKSGKLLTPTSRTNKESGKVSHFFKGQGEQRIQQVT